MQKQKAERICFASLSALRLICAGMLTVNALCLMVSSARLARNAGRLLRG